MSTDPNRERSMNLLSSQRSESDEPPAPPTRLWATVLADLRQRLAAGEFAERFPTDRELVKHYGVSRHTVREAVRQLDGVERRPRLGGRLREFDSAVAGLTATLRSLGARLEYRCVKAARRASDPVAAALGISAGRQMDVEESALLVDGEPVVVGEWWIHPDEPPFVPQLEAFLGLTAPVGSIALASTETLPAVAPPEVCAALCLAPGSAVFRVDSVVVADQQRVALARAWIRPDRYQCIARFAPAAPTSQQLTVAPPTPTTGAS